jgi:hypothetical protein
LASRLPRDSRLKFRIFPELRLGEICVERIKPRDLRGSAPDQRRLAIILRSGGVVYFGEAFRSFAVYGEKQKKKAARLPGRPFLSYGSSTLTGDLRTSAPGAYLPAVS